VIELIKTNYVSIYQLKFWLYSLIVSSSTRQCLHVYIKSKEDKNLDRQAKTNNTLFVVSESDIEVTYASGITLDQGH
jgi:hypothetical protein